MVFLWEWEKKWYRAGLLRGKYWYSIQKLVKSPGKGRFSLTKRQIGSNLNNVIWVAITLRLKRFQCVRHLATAIRKVQPESSGKDTKSESTATNRRLVSREKPRTMDKAEAYRCAWHKNNEEFIILPKFWVIKLDTATKRCYNSWTLGKISQWMEPK